LNGRGSLLFCYTTIKTTLATIMAEKPINEPSSQFATSRRQDINEFYEVVAGYGNFPVNKPSRKESTSVTPTTSERMSSPFHHSTT